MIRLLGRMQTCRKGLADKEYDLVILKHLFPRNGWYEAAKYPAGAAAHAYPDLVHVGSAGR